MTGRERALTQLVEKIIEVAAPEKIVLFGSRAYGKPRGNSDVDLLIVAEMNEAHKRAAFRIRAALSWNKGLDILVRSPREVRERIIQKDPFFMEIIQRGKTLYEKPRF